MDRRTLVLFAELLSYPLGDVAATARRCFAATGNPALRRFAEWAKRSAEGDIEEIYSSTFDLNPLCVPYLGHHLCPERRGLFIAGLAELYERESFRPLAELGDHLAEVLRFLALSHDDGARRELLQDAVLPALAKMAPLLEGNPYQPLLDALRVQLAWREEVRP